MADTPHFHDKLLELTKQVGRPNFVFYGWFDEEGKLQVSYAHHEMKQKDVLKGMLHTLAEFVKKMT